jgi:hypothetical protein
MVENLTVCAILRHNRRKNTKIFEKKLNFKLILGHKKYISGSWIGNPCLKII